MTTPRITERMARRRAGLTLAGIVLALIAVLAVLAALLVAHTTTRPHPTAAPPPPASITPAAPGGDATLAAETALAQRPMLQLPLQDAQPQPLTTAVAGPPIALPAAAATTGRWIPGGFPDTPEGAVAQLTALDETALTGGDPQVYATGYRQLSQPGAPDPTSTGMYALLRSMRSRAGLAATGLIAGVTVTYQISQAQIKGTAQGGRYAVVCVLGQVSAGYQGQITSLGIGDCQAMTVTDTGWRIAAGAMAAAAPCAWPGSAPALDAGYRAVTRP